MTIPSRLNDKRANRVSARSLSTKSFSGAGNMSAYVKGILPTVPRPAQDHNPVNGRFLSNAVSVDRATLAYVTERANRYADSTGHVPTADVIATWL